MERAEEIIQIPVDVPIQKFHNHLSYNDRIIFSAKFGDGKTYFLNEFRKKYKSEYLFITIYPVNYQVEENRDIFELIKRDILFQLCENKLVTDKIDVDTIIKSAFDKSTIIELVDFLTNVMEVAIPGASLVSKLIKKFSDVRDKYECNKRTTNSYFDKFRQSSGIYEYDCYSQLITNSIEQWKSENHGKKIILIIEDMDRIDPAHVFRILNIFSAHIDRKYSSLPDVDCYCPNKFCFDKIITVCHFQNLNNIFSHIYGKDSDFEGYIAKFTTQYPFHYSIDRVSQSYLLEQISKICNISSHFLSGIETITEEIKKLSIRKRIRLIENIDDQIIQSNIPVFSKYTISTRCPATRFLVILKRLHIDMPGKLYPILYSNPNETIKLVDKLWGKFVSTKQEATLSIFKSNHDDYLSFKLYPTIANNEIESINFHSFINVLHGNQETDYIKILFDELLEYII